MRKNYKVAEIINLFGSAENFIGSQFKYLKNNGYEMHLICSPHERLESFSNNQGCYFKAIPFERQLSPLKDLKSLIKLYRYLKNSRIDVVICHQMKATLLGVLAARIAGIKKIILFEHGALYETAKGMFRKMLIQELRFVNSFASKMVCVSPYILELGIKDKTSKPEIRTLLGPGSCGGIDTIKCFNPELFSSDVITRLKKDLGIEKDTFVIGFVGRLVRDKGVIELLESFNLLQNRFPEKKIKLLIIGEPEKWDGLPEITLKELSDNPDIIFTGFIPRERMPQYYLCMDIMVLPSYREGMPTCNLEAQAMGIPVITSKISGTRDSIIENKTGLYCDINGQDIANQIIRLFDETMRKSIGNNGKTWVRDSFDHSKVWPYIKEILDEITGQSQGN